MKLRGIVFILIIFANPIAVHGQDYISVWGTGQESCGKWLAERNNNVNRTILLNWFMGFITANNWYLRTRQVRPPDTSAVAAFVDLYCEKNPLHGMSLAAAALVSELGGKKADHDWKR